MKRITSLSMIVLVMSLVGAVVAAPALAADEHNTVPGLTAEGKALGLHGVDPVAFVQLGNRIEGSHKFTADHENVAYYFATKENMKAFKKNPAKYAPQNGGFCTFGVSVAKKFDGNPRYAAVEDGKLYVFLNEDIFRMFDKDRSGTISKAASNWKKIRTTAAADL